MHNYSIKALILTQYSIDNNSHAASSMAATHAKKHRASASRDTAHVDYAYRNQEDIIPEWCHIFYPLYFTSSNLRIYSRKIFFRCRWEDLTGRICYWWAHVCKLQYNNIYPYYSAYISFTISLSVEISVSVTMGVPVVTFFISWNSAVVSYEYCVLLEY